MAATTATHAHAPAGRRLYAWVWAGLSSLTGVEVFLAYLRLDPRLMLVLLLGFSVVKAGLIMAYFMHLRFERFSLFITLVPVLVVCISLLTIFFPDSLRLLEMRPR
jgi:cytochrome c oxidase subunit 4